MTLLLIGGGVFIKLGIATLSIPFLEREQQIFGFDQAYKTNSTDPIFMD